MLVGDSPAYRQRFAGTARLYGEQALRLLAQSHVCVIGIGGVGSWAVEALARTGIGALTLIDMDDVCISNTNRQIHALQQTVGQQKAEVMAQRVTAINPECDVTVIDDFLTEHNVIELMNPRFDYIIDAIDSVRPKAALLAYCRRNKLPVITIGAAGGQIDPTQIQVADLARTVQDPLAARLRYRLQKEYHLSRDSRNRLGIDCVFSTEQLRYPQNQGGVSCRKNSAVAGKGMDCNTGFGAATMVTATFGFVAVAHVVKKMLLRGGALTK